MTIDDRAREASAALHAEVAAATDTEAALARVLSSHHDRQRRRLPLLAAAAAVLAVVAGSTAVVASGDDDADDEVTIEVDPDPDADPDAEGTPLRLLAPDDGRQSVGLPVTVEPAVGLADGQTVQVTASGFEPGESVGVVQCTADAREPVYAGVDACRISPFTQLTADAEGDVVGELAVSRTLTVPFSGTVDCAAAAGACLIGVGALANYDRSGGMVLGFAGGEDAVAIPTVSLSRSSDLGDGEVVHVSGSGFSGDAVALSICATSPASCWGTGDPALAVGDPSGGAGGTDPTIDVRYPASLAVGADGTIDGDVPLWRFLPGDEPGTYVDCHVSACSLRISGVLAPPPVALGFSGAEGPPVAPDLAIQPGEGLRPGDAVEITGSGFAGSALVLSVCATQPASEASSAPGLGSQPFAYCLPIPRDGSEIPIDDGGFRLEATLGSFEPSALCQFPDSVDCPPAVGPGWVFELQAYVIGSAPDAAFQPPVFSPPPVPLDLTP